MFFTVGTFNLRNLALPNVNVYQDLSYSEDEYSAKMNWSIEQLQRLNADVVAFQEIFHEEALKELVLRAGYSHSTLLVAEDADLKPKVGLLSRFPIKYQQSISMLPTSCQTQDIKTFRRPLIHAELELTTKQSLHVFAIHLKSKQPLLSEEEDPFTPLALSKGASRALQIRAIEATAIRALILDTLPDPVLVIGDFNDVSQSVTTQIICGPRAPHQATLEQKQQFKAQRLFPVSEATALKRYTNASYTYLYNGWHETIDHILLSHHFAEDNQQAIGRLQFSHTYNDHLVDHRFYGINMPKHISDHGQLVANIKIFETPESEEENSV